MMTQPVVITTTTSLSPIAYSWTVVDYLQPPQTVSRGADLPDGLYRVTGSCYTYAPHTGCTFALHRSTPTGYPVWQSTSSASEITLTADRYYLTAAYSQGAGFYITLDQQIPATTTTTDPCSVGTLADRMACSRARLDQPH
jgi:hypothetical protein